MYSAHTHSAKLGARFMAFLIDSFLLWCIHIWCFTLLWFTMTEIVNPDVPGLLLCVAALLGYLIFFPPILSMAYFTILHAYKGQTLGKAFMGIQVATVDDTPLSMGRSFLRWVGTLLSALPMAAGFFWAFVDQRHQAWHDKVACTKVVDVRNILTKN